MITSESIKTIGLAFLKAQKEMHAAELNSVNPYFKSKYSDLAEVIKVIKGPLNDNGLFYTQSVDSESDVSVVETRIIHAESGEYIGGRTKVENGKPGDPQAFGKGITYTKRYALLAITGLYSEDDDAEGAMARNGKKNGGKPKEEKPKPEVDMMKMTSDGGIKFIKGFKSAKEAIGKLAETRTVTEEARVFVEGLFEEEQLDAVA